MPASTAARPGRKEIHGGRRTALYDSWHSMVRRCYDPKVWNYDRYGGRGIGMPWSWRNCFWLFKRWALANGYQEGLQIDRIDNDQDYGPINCRWSTRSQQMRNTRKTVLVTAFGETKSLVEWVEDPRCQVSYDCLKQRIGKIDWPAEIAVSTPAQPGKRFAA